MTNHAQKSTDHFVEVMERRTATNAYLEWQNARILVLDWQNGVLAQRVSLFLMNNNVSFVSITPDII